jgi:hypothetical protein
LTGILSGALCPVVSIKTIKVKCPPTTPCKIVEIFQKKKIIAYDNSMARGSGMP